SSRLSPDFRPWRLGSSSPRVRRPWLPIAGTAPRGGRSAPIWSSRARLPLILVVELGFEQRSEIGRARAGAGIFGAHTLHRLRLLGVILGLDRKIDRAVLAIDVDDHGGDRVAFLQVRPDVLDAVARYLRRAQIGLDVAVERDDCALAVERLDRARDDAALVVCRHIVRERVAVELFHPQRDAPAFLVDFEDHDLDLVAELHDLGRMDVLVRPVHFRDVDETLDALLDLDERTVVGDVGDLAEQARARRVAAREADPGVLPELLHAQRYAILFLIELEDLGRDLVAD